MTVAELSDREAAVLTAAAIGLTADVAARSYKISPRTLRRYQVTATKRLGAHCLTHAIALAAARGLIRRAHLEDRMLPEAHFPVYQRKAVATHAR